VPQEADEKDPGQWWVPEGVGCHLQRDGLLLPYLHYARVTIVRDKSAQGTSKGRMFGRRLQMKPEGSNGRLQGAAVSREQDGILQDVKHTNLS
jgi:hypothetical protein